MYIDDAIAMGLCTNIVPFYSDDIKEFKKVNWSVLEGLYPEMRFYRIAFRAEVDLTLAFETILIVDGEDYIDPEYYDYLDLKRNICPKPPGSKTIKTIVREYGDKFYTIGTLWELKHKLDDCDARYGESSWRFEVYIPEIEAEQHCNKYSNDYDELGRETTVTEALYYVQDINRYIKTTEGINEY